MFKKNARFPIHCYWQGVAEKTILSTRLELSLPKHGGLWRQVGSLFLKSNGGYELRDKDNTKPYIVVETVREGVVAKSRAAILSVVHPAAATIHMERA